MATIGVCSITSWTGQKLVHAIAANDKALCRTPTTECAVQICRVPPKLGNVGSKLCVYRTQAQTNLDRKELRCLGLGDN